MIVWNKLWFVAVFIIKFLYSHMFLCIVPFNSLQMMNEQNCCFSRNSALLLYTILAVQYRQWLFSTKCLVFIPVLQFTSRFQQKCLLSCIPKPFHYIVKYWNELTMTKRYSGMHNFLSFDSSNNLYQLYVLYSCPSSLYVVKTWIEINGWMDGWTII